MSNLEERQLVLTLLEDGKIDSQQAERLITSMGTQSPERQNTRWMHSPQSVLVEYEGSEEEMRSFLNKMTSVLTEDRTKRGKS